MSRRQHRSWKELRLSAALAGVFLLSFVVLSEEASRTSFHGDESGWISSSYYYADLTARLDFDWQRWRCPDCPASEYCCGFGSLNPHLGHWLIGFPLLLSNPQGPPFDRYYRFGVAQELNRQEGRVPGDALLLRARRTAARFGALCCVAVLAAVFLATGRYWPGLLAVGLLLANPLFVVSTTRVMTDAFYNFFLLGILLGCLLALPAGKARRRFPWLLPALSTGLAASVKVTGLLLGSGLWLGQLLLLRGFGQRRRVLRSGLVFLLATLLLIYAVNPFYWVAFDADSPAELWNEAMQFGSDFWAAEIPRRGLRERYPGLAGLSHPLEFPLSFLRWRTHLRGNPEQGWQGNRLLTIHTSLFSKHSTFPFQWIVALAGLSSALLSTLRERRLGSTALVSLWFLVNYALLVLFLPLDWGRFYLPAVVAMHLVTATELHRWADAIKRRFAGEAAVSQ